MAEGPHKASSPRTNRLRWIIKVLARLERASSTKDRQGLEVIKPEYSLKLKIKRNDWLLADVSASSQSLSFILS